MKPPYFMENRIRIQLKRNGLQYQFFRSKLDKFKQPTEELEQVADIKGLYHESNSYIQTTDKGCCPPFQGFATATFLFSDCFCRNT